LEFVNLNASRTRAIKLATGCTTYYRVSDQATRKVYYTTDIDRTDSGGVVFEDAKTGHKVTLQSSNINEVSRMDFEAGRRN
jgi:hypothetical protein